jgi:hypothetical protein
MCVCVCVCVYRLSLNFIDKGCILLLSIDVPVPNPLCVFSTQWHKRNGKWGRAPCKIAKHVAFLSNASAKSNSHTSWLHISCPEEWGCECYTFSYEFLSVIFLSIDVIIIVTINVSGNSTSTYSLICSELHVCVLSAVTFTIMLQTYMFASKLSTHLEPSLVVFTLGHLHSPFSVISTLILLSLLLS